MLVNYLEQTQPQMTMTILADYEIMVDWAVWLGFEPVGGKHIPSAQVR